MPFKDPAEKLENNRRYYAANRDNIRTRNRAYVNANREQIREQQRAYREANRDKINDQVSRKRQGPDGDQVRARDRAYYQANRDRKRAQARARREANHDQVIEKERQYASGYRDRRNERQRQRYQANPERHRADERRRRHGLGIDEWFAQRWLVQDGRCYIGGEPLTPGDFVEHDHTHCGPDNSCAICRRGIACKRCNSIVGLAGDDPDFLRRIADNFEPVLRATRARIAAAPQQGFLDYAE